MIAKTFKSNRALIETFTWKERCKLFISCTKLCNDVDHFKGDGTINRSKVIIDDLIKTHPEFFKAQEVVKRSESQK